MRVTAWLRSPSIRWRLFIAAALVGCFVWAMVIVGLSFPMVEQGSGQWWVIPLFGAFVLAIAVLVVRWVPAAASRSDAAPADLPAPVAAQVRPRSWRSASRPSRSARVNWKCCTTWRRAARTRRSPKVLFVAPGTVKAHLNHIFRKLEAASGLQAVAHAREAGLLD